MSRRTDKAPPSFPLYYKDAYTDASFVAFDWAAQGLFWRLACWQWDDGDIPADVELVVAIVGKPRETRKLWPLMLTKFGPIDGQAGRLRNGRVHELREKMLEDRRRKQTGAEKTNNRRWGNESLSDQLAIAERSHSDVTPATDFTIASRVADASATNNADAGGEPVGVQGEARALTPQQASVKLVLDAFAEDLRPHPGLAARWISQIQEAGHFQSPIQAAEEVREIVWKNATKPAEYVGKCVGTRALDLRAPAPKESHGRNRFDNRNSTSRPAPRTLAGTGTD